MDTLENIDRFNRTVLLVLAQLHETFPVPVDLNTSSIAMAMVPEGETFEDTFASFEPTYYAVDFLAQEGFLTHMGKTVDGRAFMKVRLTSKALAVMGATPSSLDKSETVSSQVRAVVKSGVRSASAEVVKKATDLIWNSAPAIYTAVKGLAS